MKPCALARFLLGEPSLAQASKPWWLSREDQSDTLLQRLLPIKAQQQVVALIGRHSPKQASEVGQRNQPRHCLLGGQTSLLGALFYKVRQYKSFQACNCLELKTPEDIGNININLSGNTPP